MKNKMIYRKKGWMLTAMLGFCLGGSVAAQTISSDTISYVAYGTQPEWITTGAVSSVKGSALENSFTTNAHHRSIHLHHTAAVLKIPNGLE